MRAAVFSSARLPPPGPTLPLSYAFKHARKNLAESAEVGVGLWKFKGPGSVLGSVAVSVYKLNERQEINRL